VLKFFGENIITANDGADWKRHRLAANPAFNEDNCHLVCQATVQQLDQLFAKWEKSLDCVNVDDSIVKLTLAVISDAAFGLTLNLFSDDSESVSEELKKQGFTMSFQRVMEIVSNHTLIKLLTPVWAMKTLPFFGFKKLKEVDTGFREFEAYAQLFVTQRRAEIEKTQSNSRRDLLSLLLNDEGLTNQDIIANSFIFMLAGHETTAHTVTFVIAMLAIYPEIQEKVYEEAVRVLDGVGKDKYYSKFNQLQYTKAVFEETLRMYPSVAAIPKYTVEDTRLGDYLIPSDTIINLSPWGLHYNEKVWDNPHEFRPERFLNRQAVTYDHIPFSLGNRSCIGRKFAYIEATFIIASICKTFEIIPRNEAYKRIVSKLTLGTKEPVKVGLVKRNK